MKMKLGVTVNFNKRNESTKSEQGWYTERSNNSANGSTIGWYGWGLNSLFIGMHINKSIT